jgi:chromosome segregation ATPase
MSSLSGAENRMQSIEERLVALESSAPVDNSSAVEAAVRAYQAQILGKLKDIRHTLVSEGGDVVTIKSERDAAVAENVKLKKEIERLNYRVRHLIKALEEEENKNITSGK